MGNDFDDFATDSIAIVKTNGEKFENLKASVQREKIYFWSSTILVEPRDLIQRFMSNGGVETYEVIDPGFVEEIMDFSAHYQMKVRKMGLPEGEKAVQSITYNISGANARVNNHSTDNSVNFSSVASGVSELVEELKKEVSRASLSVEERQDALEVVHEIEQQATSEKPKRAVIKSLIAALPAVESISVIGASLASMMQL